MIYASFNDNDRVLTLSGLIQWDYGQKLTIRGLHIPGDTIECHFAEQGKSEAVIVIGEVNDCGDIVVDIPNFMLKSGRDIRVYVYLATATEGETIRQINLSVKPRPKPTDYNAPADKNVLEQILEIAQSKADGLTYDGNLLQLTSGGKPIGEGVEITAGSDSDMTPIENEEIDTIIEGG